MWKQDKGDKMNRVQQIVLYGDKIPNEDGRYYNFETLTYDEEVPITLNFSTAFVDRIGMAKLSIRSDGNMWADMKLFASMDRYKGVKLYPSIKAGVPEKGSVLKSGGVVEVNNAKVIEVGILTQKNLDSRITPIRIH